MRSGIAKKKKNYMCYGYFLKKMYIFASQNIIKLCTIQIKN